MLAMERVSSTKHRVMTDEGDTVAFILDMKNGFWGVYEPDMKTSIKGIPLKDSPQAVFKEYVKWEHAAHTATESIKPTR